MSEPFLAEIRILGFNFAPRGWALCDGQFLQINQNQSLYSLLGTTYGGDGRTTFALPDMRGRTPMHVGNGHQQGQKAGEETHTLSGNEMPQHSHAARASTATGNQPVATGNVLAGTLNLYAPATSNPTLQPILPATLTNAGGSQQHDNMQPWLALNFAIALQGLFPSRN